MADYIQKQIDMIGQLVVALAIKIGLDFGGGGNKDLTLQEVKEAAKECDFNYDIDEILSQYNPVVYMTETLEFSDDALETFVEIILNTDVPEGQKKQLLTDALNYLDGKGNFSFRLHSHA